ncbi:MAG: isochorismatase family cysteine hydrolase [Nitrososphaerota archaeon]|nr:cysteine hydrolase [Candidatus Geocrenenecus dongiae]
MFPEVVHVPEKFDIKPVSLKSLQTALIIVDMQNAFVHEKGRLFVPDSRKIIEHVRKLLEKARSKKVSVIYTQDWHTKDDVEFSIWGEHAVANTWEAEIIDELKPLEDEIVIRKLRYDGFYGTYLEDILRMRKIEYIVITGTVANICVLHTAGSAALRGFKIVLPVDCIAALNEFDYMTTLRQVSFLYKGILTKSDLVDFI